MLNVIVSRLEVLEATCQSLSVLELSDGMDRVSELVEDNWLELITAEKLRSIELRINGLQSELARSESDSKWMAYINSVSMAV